jgi:hypothetical protein
VIQEQQVVTKDSGQFASEDWKVLSDTSQQLAAELRGNVARKDFEAWAAKVLPVLDKLTFMFCASNSQPVSGAELADAVGKLARHSPVVVPFDYYHVAEMVEREDGEWVRLEDVEALLSASGQAG